VGSMHSLAFGAIAGVVCFFAIEAKFRVGFDDSLDVVGIHWVGGVVGGVLLGFFADASAVPAPPGETNDFIDGVFFGGGVLLWNQVLSIAVVTVYSFAATWIIASVIKATMGIRVSAEVEMAGIDVSDHGEAAYQL